MTDTRDALMRAILVDPWDDVARLVLADHFEENGEPERAEFIRDCVWMNANHTDCPQRLFDVKYYKRANPLRCGACEYCTARRRAEKFYAKHVWLPGVNYAVCFNPSPLDGPMPTGPGLTLAVSRGFVSVVRCRLADWVGGECSKCAGHGDIIGDSTGWAFPCDECNTTGLTPGLGPRIVAEQPVERVEVTDVPQFVRAGDVHRWLLSMAAQIGPDFVSELSGQLITSSGRDARERLMVLLLNWARREAGLPPLTPASASPAS